MHLHRLFLFVLLSLPIVLISYPQNRSDVTENKRLEENTSKVVIGSGATIFVDSKSSATLWYDQLEKLSGSKYIEDSEKNYISKIIESENQNSKLAEVAVPTDLIISKAFPNPFNPEVIITYGLPRSSIIRIVIYDINGRKIIESNKEIQGAGWHDYKWNATDQFGQEVGSGIYMMIIKASDKVKHQKITFIK